MSYEYKELIEQAIIDDDRPIDWEEGFNELDEVYAKAQAFDEIQRFMSFPDTPLGVQLYHIEEIIKQVEINVEGLKQMKNEENKDLLTVEYDMKNIENLKTLIQNWATNRNLHTADSAKQALKLGEEYGELCEGLAKGKTDLIKDALGDMFVVMVILAMQEDLDVTECIEMAYNEIKDRKGKMIDGVFVKEADIDDEVHR